MPAEDSPFHISVIFITPSHSSTTAFVLVSSTGSIDRSIAFLIIHPWLTTSGSALVFLGTLKLRDRRSPALSVVRDRSSCRLER
ncbi:hypothetical protein CF335_g9601, partial [Tilletia laevis]